jgi:hypothetical protein
MEEKDSERAKEYMSEIKTDSFKTIALQEFPNFDRLIKKFDTRPYKVVESIRYEKNHAGIGARVHTVLVDSLYFEDVEKVVLPRLERLFDDGNSHQIYLHKAQPNKLGEIASKKDRMAVIQVAKEGAFAYIVKISGVDADLMGVDKRGNYIEYEGQ